MEGRVGTQDQPERRAFVRVELNLLIQFRFDSSGDFVCDYAKDISEGGLFISTTEAREVGAMIYLQLTLKNAIRLVEGLGRVAHVGPAGLGVAFVNFDPGSMDLVRALVRERLAGANIPLTTS